ncbi:hypothetical protein CKAH01_06105 [Colletotrichum kahawae]|uniref:DUF6536 domain-containing protein n=1 Tax=Colletotrichum kahawae TaxID=34407 RepID=A0AAD9Y977_COLKA|nr:hypothetical protein CKAH01_06105 [Colletotrichum kahawae]
MLMSASLLLLIGVLIAALSAGGDFLQAFKFYESDCRNAAITNTMLHLFLNILSTIVLASSNFFMQILNSPSRSEVDAAHARGGWLDIGIPSWRNAFRLSRSKLFLWSLLALTSVMIHLLFNSSVFQIHSRDGPYSVTVMTEEFLKGGFNSAPYSSNFTASFKEIMAQASSWERIGTNQCGKIYSHDVCTGLMNHGNVALIAETINNSHLFDTQTGANVFWYSAHCRMQGLIQNFIPICESNCTLDTPYYSEPWGFEMTSRGQAPYLNPDIPFVPLEWGTQLRKQPPTEKAYLNISHCLVQPKTASCAVAFSRPLFLAVVLSILLKVVTCIVALQVLGSDEPLVTPGDAIASFISVPNDATPFGLLSRRTVRQRQWDMENKQTNWEPFNPRKWGEKRHFRAKSASGAVWISSYSFLSVGLGAAAGCLIFQLERGMPL